MKRSVIDAASVPGRGREDERVRAVVPGLGHHLEGALEVVVGLAREADDDVGGHGEIGHCGARRREAFEVASGGVSAMHRREHAIASGLQRQVQVLAHRSRRGHRLDRLGAQVLGMRAGEPHTTDAVDRADGPEQLGEERPHRRGATCSSGREREVPAVGVHVLPEQRHLGDAVGGQALDLGDEGIEGPADLRPAHRGHDAERA